MRLFDLLHQPVFQKGIGTCRKKGGSCLDHCLVIAMIHTLFQIEIQIALAGIVIGMAVFTDGCLFYFLQRFSADWAQ